MNPDQTIQRRSFLAKAGLLSAGTISAGTMQTLIQPPQAHSQTVNDPQDQWPFPFFDLVPNLAAERGYEAFYQGACCYGTVQGILSQWKELHGEPFSSIPADMFKYGEGGVAGWGSVCGTLNGASAMINLVCEYEDAKALIDELVAWYSSTAVPVFIPAGKEEITKTTSGSPLCHVSVSKWCKAAQVGATSTERKERCARLVADVAMKTCNLLNDHFNETFVSEHGISQDVTDCMECHGPNAMNSTLGKMSCTPCHEQELHPLSISNWGKH